MAGIPKKHSLQVNDGPMSNGSWGGIPHWLCFSLPFLVSVLFENVDLVLAHFRGKYITRRLQQKMRVRWQKCSLPAPPPAGATTQG